MSFGFGVGDFLTVIKLANKVRKDFAGAPDQFQQITTELRNLTIMLQDVEVFLTSNDIPDAKENDLREIMKNCRHVLEDLQKVVDENTALEQKGGMTKRARRAWTRLKWDPNDIRDLRNRMTSNITALNTFTTSNIRDNVNKLVASKDKQKRQEILDWLTPVDSFAQQSDFIRRRQPGTGQWMLESSEYKEWKAGTGEILFCHGIPGAGKTILSSIAVDDLQGCQAAENVAVCHFYCNFQRQEEQRLENIVLSFTKQLAQVTATIPDCLVALYDKHEVKRSRPKLEEVTETLHSISRSFSKVFFVVDALDEWQTMDGYHGELIEYLLDLRVLIDAKIIATSRPIPHIVEKFKNAVSLEVLASPSDIRKYIEGNVQNLPGFVCRDPALIVKITNAIAKATNGMFLLAKLHLDSLKGKRSPAALKNTLETLARGSDAYTEAYRTTMTRINGQLVDQKELALQALTWIVYAKRALSTFELQHALGVEVDAVEFSEDNIPDLHDTISACCGLVTIDEASGIVRLVHYTTQEFFVDQGQSYLPDAHAQIASTCVTYLSFDAFNNGPCKEESAFEQRLSRFPLYDYSSRFWGVHAQHLHDVKAVQYFLSLPAQVEGSSQALLVDRRYLEYLRYPPSQVTALHLAAYFGFADYLAIMHHSELSIDPQDSHSRTPLSWAAEKGHEEIVRLLLDKNAQVDFADEGGRTPLSWATRNGHEEIMRLLLDKNAQVDFADKYGRTPLSWAAEKGHEEIVRLLLDKNAQVDFADKYGRTPLSWAAGNGYEEIVRLLLDKNAQVDFADEGGRTPLSWAAGNGYEEIVRLLLDKNAQVDFADKGGRTPLSWAARNGHEEIMRLLLDKNAQVDFIDEGGQTPLSWAAEKGHEEIVRLLLDKNAQVDFADKYGRTPLSYATGNGHEQIMRLLLDKNVQADPADKYGRTPLSWAAGDGHEEVVRLLLDKNVQVDLADKDGRTPLSWAAENGHEKIVRLLLDKNAQVDTLDTEFGQTPLSWAAGDGHEEVVRLLLDKNAQVDFADKYGRTPLSWAAGNGHEEVVLLLLDKNAQVDTLDTVFGQTPLSWAARDGHEEVVRLLLDKNAQVDFADEGGQTPLSYATGNGHKEIVRLLLDKNAQVDFADKDGQTPLSWAAEKGHEEIVRLLLDKNAQVDFADKYGRIPLSWATRKGHEEIVRLLLDKNAQVDFADKYGQTLLSYATGNGYKEIVRLLLDKNAQVDFADKNGQTPLSWAAENGHEEVVRLLLDRNAQVDFADKDGRTPLLWAARNGHEEIVRLLRHHRLKGQI